MRGLSPVVAVVVAVAALAGLAACAPEAAPAAHPASPAVPAASASRPPSDPFAADEDRARTPVETFAEARPAPVLIRHARVLTASGRRYDPGFVYLEDGKIAAAGEGEGPPARPDAVVVDAHGRTVTPGIIDPHSHMGVDAVPETHAHEDDNELTDPVTAGLRAEHSF